MRTRNKRTFISRDKYGKCVDAVGYMHVHRRLLKTSKADGEKDEILDDACWAGQSRLLYRAADDNTV